MDDESSSGVNLTTANHAIFVHPLLAIAQQQYDAYETQVSFMPWEADQYAEIINLCDL